MRILHIDSETGWRGGQNQTKLLIDGLKELSIECHFAGPQSGPLFQKLKNEIPCLAIQCQGLGQIKSALQIRHYVLQHAIDIIDCHSSKAHNLAYLAHLMGMRTAIVVHRRVDYLPGKTLSQIKYRSKAISKYVAISNYIAKVLREYGIPTEHIAVVHSAVGNKKYSAEDRELARESIRRKHSIPQHLPIILNVAALTEQKNHRMLVQAVAQLKKDNSNFVCIVCGEGPLRKNLQTEIQRLDIAQHIQLIGHVDNIDQYYLAADLFAISSRDEGLGTSLLDASLYHLPICATNVGGIPEIVNQANTGLLSESHDFANFSRNLYTILANPMLACQMAEKSHAYVREKFSLERMVTENLKVYQEILENIQNAAKPS